MTEEMGMKNLPGEEKRASDDDGKATDAKSGKIKINQELAADTFNSFAERIEIETDLSAFDDEAKKEFGEHRNRFIKAVMKGRLVLGEDDIPVYTTRGGETIIFRPMKGGDMAQMDKKKESAQIAKVFALMASITGRPESFYSEIETMDVNTCLAITSLFTM